MKREYDIFLPLYYNDGLPVEVEKFQAVHKELLRRFDGITFFPQPNQGSWKLGDVVYRDEIVVYRVLANRSKKTRHFFAKLKERLKVAFCQEEILIVIRNVDLI